MSKEMRNMMNKFNEKLITESSLTRITKHIMEHNCAVISASRNKLNNCSLKSYRSYVIPNTNPNTPIDVLSDRRISNEENMERHRLLRSYLLKEGYGVTDVKGSYIENYMQKNAVEIFENSLFVVNLKNNDNFMHDIIKLAELFCQDSVLILSNKGEHNYLLGTNESPFPGFLQKHPLNKYQPGIEGKFMTKVRNRPFTTETYEDLQINTKMMVEKYAAKIKELIK